MQSRSRNCDGCLTVSHLVNRGRDHFGRLCVLAITNSRAATLQASIKSGHGEKFPYVSRYPATATFMQHNHMHGLSFGSITRRSNRVFQTHSCKDFGFPADCGWPFCASLMRPCLAQQSMRVVQDTVRHRTIEHHLCIVSSTTEDLLRHE